jgi:hypothetical protein
MISANSNEQFDFADIELAHRRWPMPPRPVVFDFADVPRARSRLAK